MREELPPHLLVEGLEKLVREHEEVQRHHFGGGLLTRVHHVLGHYRDLAAHHLNGVEHFKQEVVNYLRALVLLAESVGSAGTHREKDARLRGLVELLESAIGRVQKAKVEMAFSRWSPPDLWRSDYPAREYLRSIHQLQGRVKELEEEEKAKGDDTGRIRWLQARVNELEAKLAAGFTPEESEAPSVAPQADMAAASDGADEAFDDIYRDDF